MVRQGRSHRPARPGTLDLAGRPRPRARPPWAGRRSHPRIGQRPRCQPQEHLATCFSGGGLRAPRSLRGGSRRACGLSGKAARQSSVDIPHAVAGSPRAHQHRLSAAVRAGPRGAAQERDARIVACDLGPASGAVLPDTCGAVLAYSAPRAARREGVHQRHLAFASIQLMTSLAVARTKANVNPPASGPQITGADT